MLSKPGICERYLCASRNVTGDNFFTSMPLVNNLLTCKTTYVGTIRRNKRDLPPQCKDLDGRQRGDSKHYYNDNNTTLCSFWDKGQSPVLLVSSMHGVQNDLQDTKPDIVEFYNSTKSGVDKLVRNLSSKRKCTRWP